MSQVPPISQEWAAEAWLEVFGDCWRAPGDADAFADRVEPWLDPQVRLVQPQLPTTVGRRAFRERFVRPLFALVEDLRGEVQRSAIGEDCVYVELTLSGRLGGRNVSWRVCDRMSMREGLVTERETYFDPSGLLVAIITNPRAWPALIRLYRTRR